MGTYAPDNMEQQASLELLGEKKILHQTVDPRLLVYCPSMDLVALGSTDQQVLVYRLNGQRVYGASQKAGSLRVEGIRWKPNGQLLAIAWSDGSVRMVGAESSKTVHQFSTGDEVSGITCVAWVSNSISKKHAPAGPKKGPESWQNFLGEAIVLSGKTTPLDLPRDLSLIDIETSLPKLSVLAAGGSSEEVFCSRSSLDALFRPFDSKSVDSVDVMVVGTKEGHIHLSIYDSFVVGSFKAPVNIGPHSPHLVLHASHKRYSTHILLMKSSSAEDRLYFAPMDLRFISASSNYLSLLASRSTALQNLLRYIHQVQILMTNEWKGTQELPGKFLRDINETLGENANRTIVQALYHSVATGHTFPAVREWLVDELTERGHKRWDKVVTTGLENLRRLVHENMLPALDRCSVILSRFAGIAKFQGRNDTVGFSGQQINLMIDTVACLHLVSSKILIQVVDELDLFAAFSAWLRYEIDRLASDASPTPNEEILDKEATIDHSKVLLYLQTAMATSPLSVFFGDASEDKSGDWTTAEAGLPMFDLLDDQLQKQERGLLYATHLPRVDFLCDTLARQANIVFGQIAEAEKRNVLFGQARELGNFQGGAALDMKIFPVDDTSFNTLFAAVPKGQTNQIQVIRIALSIENGVSSVHEVTSSTLELGEGQVQDMKFTDENVLILLLELKGSTTLLRIPLRAHNEDLGKQGLTYSPHTPNSNPSSIFVLDNEEIMERYSTYRIPDEEGFVPEKIEIREGKHTKPNRETRRIVILGKDRLHYKIFNLPAQRRERDREAEISKS